MRSSTQNYRFHKGRFEDKRLRLELFEGPRFQIRQWKSGKKSENDDIKSPKSITGRANWPFQKRHVIKQEYKSVYCMSSVTLVDQYEKISKTYHLVSHYLSCPRNFLLNKIIKVHPTLYQKLAKFCPYIYSNDSSLLPRELFT